MAEVNFPTEVVDLPSQGLLYPKDSPLSSGKIEVNFMTAKEEDILTSKTLVNKGIVIDRLLASIILDDINPDDFKTKILFFGLKNTAINDEELVFKMAKLGVRFFALGKNKFRLVTHSGVHNNDINYTLNAFNNVFNS